MTSIRAFSEIMRDTDGLSAEDSRRYATIIHDEALRLTRLLDDLLDLSVLENGQVSLNMGDASLRTVLDRAVSTTYGRGRQPFDHSPQSVCRAHRVAFRSGSPGAGLHKFDFERTEIL